MGLAKPFPNPVYVTRPLLPPLSEYTALLEKTWESAWLSNGGEHHQMLEAELSKYLCAPHLSLFNNGTIALLAGVKALHLGGEVITTPFTFPATPHVLHWNGLEPVFADIDPVSLTLDPDAVERLITPRTSGILGVHVYGIPCAVQALQTIADRHRLKVIYDGAHAFGTEIRGQPIAAFGDATMLSFHATKLFHTAEGGALAVRNAELKGQVDLLKNFGIKNEYEVLLPGINGKMNELQAALGIVVLRHFEFERARREAIIDVYRERLSALEGISCVVMPETVRNSCQYFVIRIDAKLAGRSRDDVYDGLKAFNVFARKYFFPLCSDYSFYRSLPSADPARLPVAQRVAREVLSLPLFGDLRVEGAHAVCDAITQILSFRRRGGN